MVLYSADITAGAAGTDSPTEERPVRLRILYTKMRSIIKKDLGAAKRGADDG